MPFPITPVRTPDAKPTIQQIWEMINLGARLVTTPTDYVSHKLYQRGKTKHDALQFLSDPRIKDLQTILNPNPEILKNKLSYDLHYRALGLPIPETVAVIGGPVRETPYPQLTEYNDVVDFISSCLFKDRHLVIKKVAGAQGAGVLVIIGLIDIEGQFFLLLSNGETRQLKRTVSEMVSSDGIWIVQERLKQHEVLDSLNSTSLNTIRVVTFQNQDGSVHIDHAVLRIGREYSQIDTYNKGGVGVRVNTRTGYLSKYGHQKPKYSREAITEHPDSKVPLGDVQIPFWDDVIRLAQRFAANAEGNRLVGWDVSITPSGPVFVEGNHFWDVNFSQIGETGLLTDDFINRMRCETGIELSNTELPKPHPVKALRLLRSGRL